MIRTISQEEWLAQMRASTPRWSPRYDQWSLIDWSLISSFSIIISVIIFSDHVFSIRSSSLSALSWSISSTSSKSWSAWIIFVLIMMGGYNHFRCIYPHHSGPHYSIMLAAGKGMIIFIIISIIIIIIIMPLWWQLGRAGSCKGRAGWLAWSHCLPHLQVKKQNFEKVEGVPNHDENHDDQWWWLWNTDSDNNHASADLV